MALTQQHNLPVVFDTLRYAKRLKEVGFTEQQAEVQAETIKELIDNNLATKKDLKELEGNLKLDIKELDTKLTRDIKELEAKLTRDIKEMGYKTIIGLGSVMVVGITVPGMLMHLH